MGSGQRADDVTFTHLTVTQGTVPEPGTLTLLGWAAIGLVAYAWRKRRLLMAVAVIVLGLTTAATATSYFVHGGFQHGRIRRSPTLAGSQIRAPATPVYSGWTFPGYYGGSHGAKRNCYGRWRETGHKLAGGPLLTPPLRFLSR